MAQFDVFRTTSGDLLLDCQSDALAVLATRVMVPLVPLGNSPERRVRLNPVFDIGGEPCVMLTQFASAIRRSELKSRVTSLLHYRFNIISAFDMMLTGV